MRLCHNVPYHEIDVGAFVVFFVTFLLNWSLQMSVCANTLNSNKKTEWIFH